MLKGLLAREGVSLVHCSMLQGDKRGTCSSARAHEYADLQLSYIKGERELLGVSSRFSSWRDRCSLSQ